ncbi:enterochelin esterase [Vibrio metschnikovii]|uniref:enterochelin esterase n=1 Tax=Vibrio metschnikovii TaxID=28172 RepID=UPI001C309F54|nr:enterochelin esterase [Vibrio metschnikovii]
MLFEEPNAHSNQNLHQVCRWLSRDGCNIGDNRWWQQMAFEGMPIVMNAEDEYANVIFIWREPRGSDIREVYIDINGVTDHHSFTMAKLSQIEGTDVWFYIASIKHTWRGGYSFIPVPHQLCQPSYVGSYQEKRAQHREWLKKLFPLSCRDELGRNRLDHCLWGMSKTPLHMPNAPSQIYWQIFDQNGGNSPIKSSFSLNWQSRILNNSRSVWLYSTTRDTQKTLPVVFILDGRFWSESLPIYDALSCATQQGVLPEALYVLIDEVDSHLRSEELSCNPLFWQALIQEIFPLISGYFTISQDPEQTVVVGQSLGGLAAMFAALNWPERFGSVVCQSGSFWWPDFSLVKPPSDYVPPESPHLLSDMSRQIHQGLGRHCCLNIFIEVGSGEDIMVDLSLDLYHQLAAQRHNLQYRVFDGGHERLCWRGGIIDGLCYLFSLPPKRS